MTRPRDFNVAFTWLPAGADKPTKTVVKTAASSSVLAIQVALRAIALDKSIPADATIKRVTL